MFALGVAQNAQAKAVSIDAFTPQKGMKVYADTKDNFIYLENPNGTYARDYSGSGKNETVYYMKKKYLATTPVGYWAAKSTTIQTDRRTFGKTGMFLRLYWDGETRTSYGIHSVSNIEELLGKDDRFASMGCLLVYDDTLNIIKKAYDLNGGTLEVFTMYGIDEEESFDQ